MSVSYILISGTVSLFDSFIKLYVPHGAAGPSLWACYWTGNCSGLLIQNGCNALLLPS